MPDPTDGVEEIPFDVADWGDRVVAPLWANDAEREAWAAETQPDPEFQALVKEQQRLQKLRLGE